MKSLVLISKNIKDTNLLINSFLNNHKIILEEDNLNINNLKNYMDSNFTHITLVYHFNNHFEIPFFTSSGFNKYKYVSDGLFDFFKYAKSVTNNLTIDILSCNLNFIEFYNDIKKVEKELDITIRYSTDLTGNIKGDWILESHNIDIKNIYFNDNINNWKYDLTNGILLFDLVVDPVGSNFFGFDSDTQYFYLKQDLILPNITLFDNNCFIDLQNNQKFDGRNYKITLSNSNWGVNNGLFSTASISNKSQPAIIKNLTIISENGISSGNGGFIGGSLQRFVNIENCISDCSNIGAPQVNTGGFVGSSFGQYPENLIIDGYTGSIYNCVYKGPINSQAGGGITGPYCATNNGRVLIKKCSTDGTIFGEFSGGIVGKFAGYHGDLTIQKCFSRGDIVGPNSGGIAGAYACKCDGSPGNFKSSFVTISFCYSEGAILGNNCGGIVGSYAADASLSSGGINSARMNLTIWTCFSTGEITGDFCGGIVGPYSSNNTKEYSYINNPEFTPDGSLFGTLIISRCYSLCNITTIGSGGICASNLCINNGSALFEYCYSIGEIGNENGGIIGKLWSGYINLNECYALNINKSSIVSTTGGGLLGAEGNCKLLTINKCYYESYNTILDYYNPNSIVETFNLINSQKTVESLKYKIDNLSSNNWNAGRHYNDIYPKLQNFTIPTETKEEGYDYKYLTYMRTPVFYYQDPSIRLNQIVFDTNYDGLNVTNITEDEVIDLRDYMFNYIFLQNSTLNFFIVSKKNMCVDMLPEIRKSNFTSEYYIVYRPNQSAITIDPYDSNVYNGIYCPLPNKNDEFKYISKDDNTNTVWKVKKNNNLNFLENKFNYNNENNFESKSYNSYKDLMVYKFLLYFSGCCFIPRILPPVQITNLLTSSTFTSNIVADITFKNDLYKNPSISTGYKIINYYHNGTSWIEKWINIVSFNEIQNDSANFKDPTWSSPYIYDNKTYGYRIIGLGINNWFNSAEYYEPVIFNYPYLDINYKQTRESNQEVKIIENNKISDFKYITGGLVIESTKIPTPKLSKITLNVGMVMLGDPNPNNSLNFSWDTPTTQTNKFLVKRYYFINNQYYLDNTYEIINQNSFKDNNWDINKNIILYSVTAIGESENINSNESLKMPYYNANEQVVIIADILCYYYKETNMSDKIFFKKDNPNLFNYFKNLSGVELSNKRSKIFCEYFLTTGIDESYITFEKSLLNFDSKYKRPGYSIINYNYYKNLYGYFKFSEFTFDYDDTGVYIPVSDECNEILFYTNDNPPDSTSEFYKYTKFSNSEVNTYFALDNGNLNNNYFMPNSDSIIYKLNKIFYINNYKLITGSLTIDDKGPIPCLTENTQILTSKGYQDIKNIKKGDYIITPDYRKVKIQNIHITIVKGNKKNYPYIIEKNSISENYPKETFKISGDHLILYKNKWILPKNIPKIKQDISKKIIKYYHIELENYETDHLIINNGTIVESFGGYKKYHNVYINRIKNLD